MSSWVEGNGNEGVAMGKDGGGDVRTGNGGAVRCHVGSAGELEVFICFVVRNNRGWVLRIVTGGRHRNASDVEEHVGGG